MEKISLKILDFYNLDVELNGMPAQSNSQPGVMGILKEKLPLVTKYWLSDLAKRVAAEKASVEELKNDLIKKYGKSGEDGTVAVPIYIDNEEDGKKVLNPDYLAFEKEFGELLNTEREIEYKPIKLSDIEKLETSENYATLFRLVKVDEQPSAS